jgi:hypothetical protein
MSHRDDSFLDLTLLPTRRWRADNRIDEIVAAHLCMAAPMAIGLPAIRYLTAYPGRTMCVAD